MTKKIETGIIIPDVHCPYEDKRAVALVQRVINDIKPDWFICLGDFADFYKVSAHRKDPKRLDSFATEVKKSVALLKELSKTAKNRVFISGNHEDRLERYLQDKAPELYDFVRIPDILELARLKFEYVPYKAYFKLDHMHFTHDIGTAGRYAHYQAIAAFQSNVIHGHTHRLGTAVEGNAKGKSHIGMQLGWLGDARKADYMHQIKAQRDWHLGFGVFKRDTERKIIYPTAIPIVNYTCNVFGKLYNLK